MTKIRTSDIIDIAIKLGVLAVLLSFTFNVIRPFVNPLLWAIILAVALEPLYNWTVKLTRGRRKLSAFLLIVVFAALVLVPAYYLTSSAISGASELKQKYEAGELKIPEANESVQDFPLIGSKVYEIWTAASQNLEGFVTEYQEEIVSVAGSFVNGLIGTGTGILELVLALIIGIILLATPGTLKASDDIFTKLAGNYGKEFVHISRTTIMNVVKGILGVAVIQSLVIGLAFVLADVPYAGVWAVLVLIVAIVQLPPTLITIPVIIYLFSAKTGLSAGIWSVVILLAGMSDNVLKPILMGRGAASPMLVIFLGSIGGFIAFGFIGLFLGAIVLALVYKLFIFWMDLDNESTSLTIQDNTDSYE